MRSPPTHTLLAPAKSQAETFWRRKWVSSWRLEGLVKVAKDGEGSEGNAMQKVAMEKVVDVCRGAQSTLTLRIIQEAHRSLFPFCHKGDSIQAPAMKSYLKIIPPLSFFLVTEWDLHHPPALICGFSGGNKKTQFFASFATNGNIARVKILT